MKAIQTKKGSVILRLLSGRSNVFLVRGGAMKVVAFLTEHAVVE